MANGAAHPEPAKKLHKGKGIDSSNIPTAFSWPFKNQFLFNSRPKTNENNFQTVYDDRRKAIMGLTLRGPAAELFHSQQIAITRDIIKIQFITLITAVTIPNGS